MNGGMQVQNNYQGGSAENFLISLLQLYQLHLMNGGNLSSLAETQNALLYFLQCSTMAPNFRF